MTGSVVTRRARSGGTLAMLVLGVVLMIAAVVGFVVVPEHAPQTSYVSRGLNGGWCIGHTGNCMAVHSGWSQTLYDVGRIATWAALIVGVVLVLAGLIRFGRRGAATVE